MINIIKKIYSIDSYNIYNKTSFDLSSVGSEGYGETGYESIENLVEYYKKYFNNNTVFYDLGSGVGKIVYHIGLKYNIKKSCGIEYSLERFNKSIDIKKRFNIENGNIIFINDNILNCDLSDATIIYIDNTLFPDYINDKIYDKIPKDCLVISRKIFINSRRNNEILKNGFNIFSNYGTNTIFSFIKN